MKACSNASENGSGSAAAAPDEQRCRTQRRGPGSKKASEMLALRPI